MSALLELAARCEAAEGADREVDALIWCALNGKKYAGHNPAYAGFGTRDNPETQVEFTEPPKRSRLVTGPHTGGHAKPVTASLDAAMTLVPEGMDFAVGHGIETELGGSPTDYAWCGEGGGDLIFAATAALALCAAALRARATMETVK